MNLFGKDITSDQIQAFGRHARTMAFTAVGTAATFKIISGGDAQNLQSALDHLSHGFAEIIAAISTIVVIGTGVISAASANPVVQVLKGLLTLSKDPTKMAEVKQSASIEQKAALVATTNELDSVKEVPLKPTNEGMAIASIVPSDAVRVVRMLAVILLAGLIALGNVACTPEQVAANKAKASDVLAAINKGARVAASTVKDAIDGVCSNGSTVAAAGAALRVGFGTQSGPNTTQNLANLDAALTTLNNVCARTAANPNDPAIKSLLRTAWTAYQSAAAAQAAAAKGG